MWIFTECNFLHVHMNPLKIGNWREDIVFDIQQNGWWTANTAEKLKKISSYKSIEIYSQDFHEAIPLWFFTHFAVQDKLVTKRWEKVAKRACLTVRIAEE